MTKDTLEDLLHSYFINSKHGAPNDATKACAQSIRQLVLGALPKRSDGFNGLKFHNIDMDAGYNQAIGDISKELKEL